MQELNREKQHGSKPYDTKANFEAITKDNFEAITKANFEAITKDNCEAIDTKVRKSLIDGLVN
jgi:hypothetical protein